MAKSLFFLTLLGALLTHALAANFTVVINESASHAIPSTLYGMMYESGDGGLYAELLQNRAFQQVTANTSAALNAWSAINSGASIAVVDNTPSLSEALPNSLQLTVPKGATGSVGVQNSGYSGSTFKGPFNIALKSSTTGATLASASVQITEPSTQWTQISVQLKPTATASDTNNVFEVTVDGASAAGQSIFFALFSLFPPTFMNRANGMRLDIATGQEPSQRWIWNNTIGPLTDRPGRPGDWGYVNTDGLGLLEYLEFIEDMGMQPIMAVWAGYSLGGQSIAENELGPYIQAAKDQASA
ncbi:hypothetical protein Clacol_004926 [Clathrus columnatus]|uniref:Alpha-L-arabinofuranosidase 1 catalytic domain-containing protein n=1 Tax=Clathrus columnatus TaxID=1419009 RepID=A0AAV5ABV7_9AGAM|nr:hypothetical protein Clacol_004926 [Clathrus columnatus]